MNKVLIVKPMIKLNAETLEALHESILLQKETGVVVLPWCAEALLVPEDVEIKVENKTQ